MDADPQTAWLLAISAVVIVGVIARSSSGVRAPVPGTHRRARGRAGAWAEAGPSFTRRRSTPTSTRPPRPCSCRWPAPTRALRAPVRRLRQALSGASARRISRGASMPAAARRVVGARRGRRHGCSRGRQALLSADAAEPADRARMRWSGPAGQRGGWPCSGGGGLAGSVPPSVRGTSGVSADEDGKAAAESVAAPAGAEEPGSAGVDADAAGLARRAEGRPPDRRRVGRRVPRRDALSGSARGRRADEAAGAVTSPMSVPCAHPTSPDRLRRAAARRLRPARFFFAYSQLDWLLLGICATTSRSTPASVANSTAVWPACSTGTAAATSPGTSPYCVRQTRRWQPSASGLRGSDASSSAEALWREIVRELSPRHARRLAAGLGDEARGGGSPPPSSAVARRRARVPLRRRVRAACRPRRAHGGAPAALVRPHDAGPARAHRGVEPGAAARPGLAGGSRAGRPSARRLARARGRRRLRPRLAQALAPRERAGARSIARRSPQPRTPLGARRTACIVSAAQRRQLRDEDRHARHPVRGHKLRWNRLAFPRLAADNRALRPPPAPWCGLSHARPNSTVAIGLMVVLCSIWGLQPGCHQRLPAPASRRCGRQTCTFDQRHGVVVV